MTLRLKRDKFEKKSWTKKLKMDGNGMKYIPSSCIVLWIHRCGTDSFQMASNFPPNKLYNARSNGSDRAEDKGEENGDGL